MRNFLKETLWVAKELFLNNIGKARENTLDDKRPRDVIPLVEIDRADQGLHRVCEEILPGAAVILCFPTGEHEMGIDLQVSSNLGEHFRVHQRGAIARQLALRLFRILRVEILRHGKLKNRIPEKLETLVVRQAKSRIFVQIRAVHERLQQQIGILEMNLYFFLKCLDIRQRDRRPESETQNLFERLCALNFGLAITDNAYFFDCTCSASDSSPVFSAVAFSARVGYSLPGSPISR